MNACIELYNIAGNKPKYGDKKGICRITGVESEGVEFSKWVRDTFTNFDALHEGTIISNAALFCFDEASELIQQKTNRDKPQRFRTYSHIVTKSGEWHCFTKADKQKIVELVAQEKVKIMCLTDSGQKHIFFKHRFGFWQLDDFFIFPDVADFLFLHTQMQELLTLGFGQEQIKTGKYNQSQIIKIGFQKWFEVESNLTHRRGEPIFDLAAWLMFTNK